MAIVTLVSSRGAGLLFNIPQSPPHRLRGNSSPRSATKPRQRFKTGCLSEASFPSNKQSAKPDFGRQGGSTRVTLFPHPVSWSIGAPEGVWAARRWEGSGSQWKPEAMCQAAGGDELQAASLCGRHGRRGGGWRGGVSWLEAGRETLLTCLSLHHTSPRARHCGVGVLMARQESYTSARQDRKIISSRRILKVSRKNKEAEGKKSYLYAIKYGGRGAIN